jgi:hypothetical protein
MMRTFAPRWAVVSALADADGVDHSGLEEAAGLDRVASPGATESYPLGFPSAPALAGDWPMPWNAQARAGRRGSGIPKSVFWASAKAGTDCERGILR